MRCLPTSKHSAKTVSMINQSANYCRSLSNAFKEALKKAPLGFFTSSKTPFKLKVLFHFPRPKCHYITSLKALKNNAPVYVTNVPDIDNMLKLLLDALKHSSYKDDNLVAHVEAAKLYSPWDTTYNPTYTGCTIIRISEISETHADVGCDCLYCKHAFKKPPPAGNTNPP
jgi:Holliday junction resolvase RusA-like endonuclease